MSDLTERLRGRGLRSSERPTMSDLRERLKGKGQRSSERSVIGGVTGEK